MVEFGKPPAKPKNRRFGAPPAIDEASTTLEQPEHAPAEPAVKKARKKTGRTEPFGTRATPAFIRDVKRVAFEDGLKTAELLELMLEAYKEQKRKS